MSNQSTDVKNFTRGGQITLHNLRMYIQIVDKVVLLAALVFLLVSGGAAWKLTSDYERYVFGEYLWAYTLPIFDNHVRIPLGKAIDSVLHRTINSAS